ncbi:RICIN domain-containing protein [Actinokineospora fastidiosa]|uniref:Ricin B lectin domain-containing protein n=1 Tax=Actinokineospora fastidiosa TaxID=1816 RepID=A0A918GDC9_9PSEU|nr:RICIN domain-containing protein [Actinokineospora fastidiosa]GGS29668.1 hypothetical protein GCM10010171_23750 [Actinokineospora fastidiosa]
MNPNVLKLPARLAIGAALALSTLLLTSNTTVSAGVTAAESPSASATRPIAVVLVNFTNDTIDSSTTFRTKVRDMYFGTGQSLSRYYEEASDGAVRFTPLAGQPEVLGPWTISMPAACDSGAMNTKTREALAARGISGYQSLAIWFPNRLAQCDWGGLGQMPGSTTWMPDAHGNPSGVVHELGHNFGFAHLASVTCTPGTLSGCAEAGYRGSSPMGGGGYQSGLAAPELIHAGWLPTSQRVVAPSSGTYTLTPLHAPASVTGTRVLEIPRNTTGDRITVAYRKNATTIDTGVGEGVQLHLTKEGAYRVSTLVDPSAGTSGSTDTDLDVGARITDATSGVTIETLSATATSATVRITTPYRFVGGAGGCLDIEGAATANGTPAVVWSCHGGSNQQWADPGDGTLRSLGKCLDAEAGGTADGTRVIVWDCHGGANQRWTSTNNTLRNAASGKCVDAGSGVNGTRLVLATCAGTTGQTWTRSA